MKWLPLAIPFIVGTALGLLATPGDFVFDDKTIVEANPRLQSLGSIPELFVDNYWGDFAQGGIYRPLTLTTFAIERALWGNEKATGYHLTNALLYGGCSAALAWLALVLSMTPRVASAVGVLFALHPIHVEPVASIVGRSELGAGLLVLIAVGLEVRGQGRPPGWRAAVTTGLAVLGALLFKETGVAAVPLIVLLPFVKSALEARGAARIGHDEVRRRGHTRVESVWFQAGIQELKRRWRTGVTVGLALALWATLRAMALDQPADPVGALNNLLSERPALGRWAGALEVSLKYHGMTLWPWPLSADYSYAALVPTDSLFSLTAVSGTLTWLAIGVAFLWGLRRDPCVSIGLCLYAAALVPVSNLLIPIGTIFGERLLYLPSAGALLALGAALERAERHEPRIRRLARSIVALAGLLGMIGFVGRVPDWRNELTLTAAMVEVEPRSAKANGKYGWELYRDALEQPDGPARSAQLDRAQQLLERSVEIYPDFTDSYINLSILLSHRGQLEESLAAARKARSIEPWKIGSYGQIAQVSWKLGRKEEALEACEAGLRFAPDQQTLLEVRAHVRFASQEPSLAAQDFAKVFAQKPTVEWKLMEIRSLVAANDFVTLERVLDEAVSQARATPGSPLRPELHTLLNNRGMVYARREAHEQAILDFTEALQIAPRFTAPRGNRVKSLIALGRITEARAEVELLEAQVGAESIKALRTLLEGN